MNTVGTFIQNMVGIGALTADETVEEYVRRVAHLPEKQEEAALS